MRRRWWLLVGVLVLLGVGWWWQIRPQPATPQAIKLLVREDGMYEVSLAQLNAQGVRWSASTALRLRTGDAAQPLWATADGAALRFYGAASTNPFDAARTYWLGQARPWPRRRHRRPARRTRPITPQLRCTSRPIASTRRWPRPASTGCGLTSRRPPR